VTERTASGDPQWQLLVTHKAVNVALPALQAKRAGSYSCHAKYLASDIFVVVARKTKLLSVGQRQLSAKTPLLPSKRNCCPDGPLR
jgi:hypothetical protein